MVINMAYDNRQVFSKNFRHFLKLNRKSQVALSRDLHIPITSVSNWYHGTSLPRPETTEKIAKYLGVKYEDLIANRDKRFRSTKEVLTYALSQPIVGKQYGYDIEKMDRKEFIRLVDEMQDILGIIIKHYK